jgi:[acyl-carrier-protein] S-malonyltransferase
MNRSSQPALPDLAFVFPGQGSQSPGMLADLGQRHPEVRDVFAEASDGAAVDLWAIAQSADDPRLNQTEFTQPALLAASVAVWRAWLAAGGARPARLAGHSLGEYSALVAAGVLDLADAAGLVRERGRLMQAAVAPGAGAMAAVIGSDDAVVAQACLDAADGQVVVPANFNSPGQVVIGGDAAAVDRTLELLAQRGVRKAMKLPVSVPSHTPLMRAAADHLAQAMAGLPWQAPSLPVVQNVDAAVAADPSAIRDALVRQLYLPVRWTQCVQALAGQGARRIAECGPGKVLTGLARRIDKELDARALGSCAEFDAALAAWGDPT